MLDRVALDGIEGAELLSLNTDVRTLAGTVAGEKIQLGRNLTKGLGCGGDPELGERAILEAEKEIRDSLRTARSSFSVSALAAAPGRERLPLWSVSRAKRGPSWWFLRPCLSGSRANAVAFRPRMR